MVLDFHGTVTRGRPDIDKGNVIHPLPPRLPDINIKSPNISGTGPVPQQGGPGVGVQFTPQGHNFPGHVNNAFDHFPVIFPGEFGQVGMIYPGADQLNVHDDSVSTPQRFDKKMFREALWMIFPEKESVFMARIYPPLK